MTTIAFELDDSWRHWLVENILVGTSDRAIVDVLIAQGLPEAQAWAELGDVRADGNLVPAGWMVQRLRKLESLLEALQRMRALDPASTIVPRRAGLTREQFLVEHYAANRPVILTDVADRWPAQTRWTPEYLVDEVGDEVVEVMTNRERDARYEEHPDAHRTEVPFREYVARVESSAPSNDLYLVANNRFFERRVPRRLLRDITLDERFLDPACPPAQVFFWYGPSGTVTPLHHDTSNVLLSQVRGSKRVTLVPALESHRVYNDVGVYSPVDPDAVDVHRYPRFAGATFMSIILRPGEALFIPVGWWHHVRSMEVSISVSFTGFRFPNHLEWDFPNVIRS